MEQDGRQMHLPCHSPVPCKSRLWHQQDSRALSQLSTWHNMLKGTLAPDFVYLWTCSPLSTYELCSIRDRSLMSSAQCCGLSVCTGQIIQASRQWCTPGSRHNQAVLAWSFHGPCLLAWFLPAICCRTDMELMGFDSFKKSVLRKKRGGHTGQQVVHKQPGPPAAVWYKGHHFERGKKNPVTLWCALWVLSPLRLMLLCAGRRHTLQKNKFLWLIWLCLRCCPSRESPHHVMAVISLLAPKTWSIYAAKAVQYRDKGWAPRQAPSCAQTDGHHPSPQQETCWREPTICRAILLPTPSCARVTPRSWAAQAAAQHRFQLPFPGCGTASMEQHSGLLQRNRDMTTTDGDARKIAPHNTEGLQLSFFVNCVEDQSPFPPSSTTMANSCSSGHSSRSYRPSSSP